MRPSPRSPSNPSPVTPHEGATTRESYSTAIPHLRSNRHAQTAHANTTYRSHPAQSSVTTNTRNFDSSIRTSSPPSGSSYRFPTTSMQSDTNPQHPLNSHKAIPFEDTKSLCRITDDKNNVVQPEIQSNIDKGFFKAEQDWTCYRRNYFSVACSYLWKPGYVTAAESLYLHRPNSQSPESIKSISVCITAKVDGEQGKTIDIVQHTPKRDRGPTGHPEKVKLIPNVSGSMGSYSAATGSLSSSNQLSNEFDTAYPTATSTQQQAQTTVTFDRLQFKTATANNGKRRAAQQYFHVIVELFAQVANSNSKTAEAQWIKIATKMSAPMVVRGRSPGHYSEDRRGSSTSMGPGGGSSGDSNGGPADPDPASRPPGSRGGLIGLNSSSSSRMGGAAYHTRPGSHTHSPSGCSVPSSSSSGHGSGGPGFPGKRLVEPILTSEEANGISDAPGYQYFPASLYETGQHSRPLLPSVNFAPFKHSPHHSTAHHDSSYGYFTNPSERHRYDTSRRPSMKDEQHSQSGGAYAPLQPPIRTEQPRCGRFEGVPSSRGFYPEQPAL